MSYTDGLHIVGWCRPLDTYAVSLSICHLFFSDANLIKSCFHAECVVRVAVYVYVTQASCLTWSQNSELQVIAVVRFPSKGVHKRNRAFYSVRLIASLFIYPYVMFSHYIHRSLSPPHFGLLSSILFSSRHSSNYHPALLLCLLFYIQSNVTSFFPPIHNCLISYSFCPTESVHPTIATFQMPLAC